MKTVNKSVLIWYRPEEMFNLVTDVAKYPEFLPWCDSAKVLRRTSSMTAEVGMSLGGFRKSLVTRNTHELNHRVNMHLVKGPSSKARRLVSTRATKASACALQARTR